MNRNSVAHSRIKHSFFKLYRLVFSYILFLFPLLLSNETGCDGSLLLTITLIPSLGKHLVGSFSAPETEVESQMMNKQRKDPAGFLGVWRSALKEGSNVLIERKRGQETFQ